MLISCNYRFRWGKEGPEHSKRDTSSCKTVSVIGESGRGKSRVLAKKSLSYFACKRRGGKRRSSSKVRPRGILSLKNLARAL